MGGVSLCGILTANERATCIHVCTCTDVYVY